MATKKKVKRIAIIDADLIGRKRHRFPNLACEKIAGYNKALGNEVVLELGFDNLGDYDEICVSKVFTDTPVPSWLLEFVHCEYQGVSYPAEKPDWLKKKKHPTIHCGGTGFYFDKAPAFPDEIEHHMPDYHLYDDWIESEIKRLRAEYESDPKKKEEKPFDEKYVRSQFKEYTDYSIGFLTRGCFRKCKFCVNQKFDHVFAHSPIDEFFDPTRKKICFLDDNFLGFGSWKDLLTDVIAKKKPYKFKQGLDERLLTDEKCKMIFESQYDGDQTFAFDNIADYDLIHSKLKMIRKYSKRRAGVMFYVLVGFEGTDAQDIENAFKRIQLLFAYRCQPYIMRYMSAERAPWKESDLAGMYITMARWCNQPSICKKMSIREFAEGNQELYCGDGDCAPMRAVKNFEEKYPEIAKKYFDMHFGDPLEDENDK